MLLLFLRGGSNAPTGFVVNGVRFGSIFLGTPRGLVFSPYIINGVTFYDPIESNNLKFVHDLEISNSKNSDMRMQFSYTKKKTNLKVVNKDYKNSRVEIPTKTLIIGNYNGK